MRDQHKPMNGRIDAKISAEPRNDGFVYLTIVVAAALVAAFSLHDAPQLLGTPFSPTALLSAGY
jgi:hypothetical protein